MCASMSIFICALLSYITSYALFSAPLCAQIVLECDFQITTCTPNCANVCASMSTQMWPLSYDTPCAIFCAPFLRLNCSRMCAPNAIIPALQNPNCVNICASMYALCAPFCAPFWAPFYAPFYTTTCTLICTEICTPSCAIILSTISC